LRISLTRTSVHWHGFIQPHNGGYDGVPGITQCPIPPGGSFTYKIQCTRYGPTWYHSHFTLQYGQGAVGPLMIHGPTVENWDIDLGEVLLTDHYHGSIYDIWYKERSGGPQTSDNGLINGKNMLNGGGSFSEFTFTPGKRHRLTIVNTAVDALFKFSIDQHNFTVQGADFIPIQPYEQNVLSINIGTSHFIDRY
jgi:FtsP/CotA-like multicopper oxidase with cupredoxin domain